MMKIMIITKSSSAIEWETFEPSGLIGFHDDWYNTPLSHKIWFSLDMDDSHLWFTAIHEKKPNTHPEARAGAFTPELWKYDVVELFITNAARDKYIELNLAANGAWWSAEFSKPRQLAGRRDLPFPGIQTFHEYLPDTGWAVSMRIPLAELEGTLGFSEKSSAIVSCITNSPQQQFQCTGCLLGEHPDFHQPEYFDQLMIVPSPY